MLLQKNMYHVGLFESIYITVNIYISFVLFHCSYEADQPILSALLLLLTTQHYVPFSGRGDWHYDNQLTETRSLFCL